MKRPFRFLPCCLGIAVVCVWEARPSLGIELALQTRNPDTSQVRLEKRELDPREVGIVVIDMWNYHWCMTCAARVEAMVPRMNRVLEAARGLGMQVFWAPTDEVLPHAGTPQRERAAAVPYHEIPKVRDLSVRFTLGAGPCMCGPGIACLPNYGMDAQHPDLIVEDEDWVVCGLNELYSLCREQSLTHLIYMGIATNICVMGKPPALKNLHDAGLNCVLARDLTDAWTYYDPAKGFTPDDGTVHIVADVERAGIPTINMVEEMQRARAWNDHWVTEFVRLTPWGRSGSPYLFENSTTVTLTAPWLEKVEIRYTTDGSAPKAQSLLHAKPVALAGTTTLRAAAFRGGRRVSLVGEGCFVRLNAQPPKPDVYLTEVERLMTAPPRYTWMPNVDKSFSGGPLTLRHKEYERGLGVRSPTQLLYDLKPEYDRIVALAGVDDAFVQEVFWEWSGKMARREARYPSVRFQVFIDGEQAAESPVMRVSAEPWRFDVKIPPGSRRMSLVLNSVRGRHPLDCGNWVNAGFILKK